MAYDTETKTFTGIAAVGYNCWCGIAFAVPKSLFDEYERKNDVRRGSMSLFCPLGHSMIPGAQSERDRLRDELAREKHHTEQAEANAKFWRERKHHTDRRLSAARGQITRIKNRVKHGVCPCCQRTFDNVARHMATKHPDWTPEVGTEPIADVEGLPPTLMERLTAPSSLTEDARHAWLRGAEAYHPTKHPICPFTTRGRYAYRARAWQDGLDAARAAAVGHIA